MTLRCIFCNRTLQHATVLVSGNPVGPDCARKHNLLSKSAKANKHVTRAPATPKQKVVSDKYTRDLFDELSGSTITPDG